LWNHVASLRSERHIPNFRLHIPDLGTQHLHTKFEIFGI
jgi:hypothetical protein